MSSLFNLAFELGYIIALPLIIFTLLGRFLDKKLGFSPWLVLTAIGISLIISSIGVYYKIKDEIQRETKN